MRKTRIYFGKLIDESDTLTQMFLLDWMIGTGVKHKQQTSRWGVSGISQALLDYSANEYAYEFNLFKHFDHNCGNDFFTAAFSRAVFSIPSKPVKEWRKEERVFQDKYRYFDIDYRMPISQRDHPRGFHNTNGFIWYLSSFLGANLKKEHHHHDDKERTSPKIVSIKLYTIGTGWIFKYTFSFKEFDYEPGWDKSFRQDKNEGINHFLWRVVNEMDSLNNYELFNK